MIAGPLAVASLASYTKGKREDYPRFPNDAA